MLVLQALLVVAFAGKPDPLAPAAHAGCPTLDSVADVVEHELRVEWRLQPGADPRELQAVEILVTTPTGSLHLAPLGDVSLRGEERSEVPRRQDGCALSATVWSELAGKDRDGIRLALRSTRTVGEVVVAIRFEAGDSATHHVELHSATRAELNAQSVLVTLTVTPVDIAVEVAPASD